MSSPLALPLFAQAVGKPAGSPWDRPELLYGTLAIAGALLVGGAVLYVVDRWRKRGIGPDAADAAAELTGFRGMLARGEITEDEYARLRQKAAAKMKGTAPPTSPTTPEPPPPAAAPPPTPPVPGPLPDDYFDDPQPPPRPT